MIGLVDYGAGNLQSVSNALQRLDLTFVVCSDGQSLESVERIILPGVGHFGAAARSMKASGVSDALVRLCGLGRPILGICLGMQLMLEDSEEAPGVHGLGLLPGSNRRLQAERVPHMGWNHVRFPDDPGRNGHYYFAHGYVADPIRPDDVLATAELDGREIPVAIGRDRILGVQFHPEKSTDLGLALIERFCRC